MEITQNWELVTPEIAAKMLAHNEHNRPLIPRMVSRYASLIKTGRWEKNGATIVIAKNGKLMDGQHRLSAIIKANVALPLLVVRNVEDKTFGTIDCGRLRNSTDILGIVGVPYPKRTAAALGIVHSYYYAHGVLGNRIAFYSEHVQDILKLFPDLIESIGKIATARFIAPRITDGFFYILSKIDYGQALIFFHQIITGENLSRDMPTFLFRERLIKDMTSKSRLRTRYIIALLIKTWNLFYEDKTARRIGFADDEDFPSVRGETSVLQYNWL